MRPLALRQPLRVLLVPGPSEGPQAPWMAWLEAQYPGALRVPPQAGLEHWAAAIQATLAQADAAAAWVAVAQGLGALALLRHLQLQPDSSLRAALLVAPADPDRLGLGALMPAQSLRIPNTLVLSQSDPGLQSAVGRRLAARWGSALVDLGDAGAIDARSGHERLPLAQHWVEAQARRLAPTPLPAAA